MRKVFAPHLNRFVVLGGCRIRDKHAMCLRLRDYYGAGQLPPAPPSADYSAPAMSVIANVEGNDSVGDCVLAEEAHFVGVMTGNAGTLYAYTTAQTLAAYSAITGYNPADPSTDQGADPVADLNYFLSHPYANGTKLAGWVSVDATNQEEVKFAISAFGNLKMWLGLPDSYVSPFPSQNGFVWQDDAPNSDNGHCIGSCAYNSSAVVGADSEGLQVMTWGLIGTMRWDAVAHLCSPAAGGGLAVRVTPDWLVKAAGKTPNGLSWHDLIQDFDWMGGSLPVPAPAPAPAPVNPPGPAPTAPPSLATALSALDKAFDAQAPLVTRATAKQVAKYALSPLFPASP